MPFLFLFLYQKKCKRPTTFENKTIVNEASVNKKKRRITKKQKNQKNQA